MATSTRLARASDSWNSFWFTPSDPTVLGAIRIVVGIITLLTLMIYGLDLQELISPNGWMDLPLRQEQYREAPVPDVPFDWAAAPTRPEPTTTKRARSRPRSRPTSTITPIVLASIRAM